MVQFVQFITESKKPIINGCIDDTAFNFNPNANRNDGTCIAKVLGCTDDTATNFNPNANFTVAK